MTGTPCPIYLFRAEGFAPSGDTVVSIAPLEAVVAVSGGGGAVAADGLSAAFGGAAIFRDETSGALFAGVWGGRKASRFRRELGERMATVVRREAPEARLVVRNAAG